MTAPPPVISKTAALKAERAARRQARIDAKTRESLKLADLKERAEALCKKMPPEFQAWGVTRTRAYIRMMAIVKNKASQTTIKSAKLAPLVESLSHPEKWSLNYCQALAMTSERAADIVAT